MAVQLIIMGLRGSPNGYSSRLNKRPDAFQRVASHEQETDTGLGSAQDYGTGGCDKAAGNSMGSNHG